MIPIDDNTNIDGCHQEYTSNSHEAPLNEKYFHSKCSQPQLAYEMYQRLLVIAQKNLFAGQQQYTSKDILLAAYTGCNLTYANATNTSNYENYNVQ